MAAYNTPTTKQPLTDLSASQLLTLLASGEVTSAAAVNAHIARIQDVDPRLNAVVVNRFDAARRDARDADEALARGKRFGPLHGLPITVKECFDVTGAPSTFGTSSRRFDNAQQNDPYVQRLVEAGAIIIGKTNVPQALIYNETSNAVYGRTSNPWNLKRTPGGSSGGEAAIIAAGGSPLGLATDIAGSLRLPAAFCGITSLKATATRLYDDGYARFLPTPDFPIVSVVGPMAREVDDLALMLQVLGTAPSRPLAYWVDQPEPVRDHRAVNVSRLRVAYFADDGLFTPTTAIQRGVAEAVATVKAAGATCTEWLPPDLMRASDIFVRLLSLDRGSVVRKIIRHDPPQSQIAPLLFFAGRSRSTLASAGRVISAVGQHRFASQLTNLGYSLDDLPEILALYQAYKSDFESALNTATGGPFDAIICPVTSLPAWTHGSAGMLGSGGVYCVLWNLLGYPAGVVPVTRVREDEATPRAASRDLVERAARSVEAGSAGLPVGVQVIARPWQEHIALAVMRTIQEAARTREGYPTTPVDLPKRPDQDNDAQG